MKYTTSEEFASGILEGSRLALSRAITLVESEKAEDQKTASVLLNSVIPHTGNSIRIGITGVPGAGKSTFIEALGSYLTEKSLNVAVLAIDPSSLKSGGSILADKTRMEKLSVSPNAFIRPSPSSSYLGGVAKKTRETMLLCEAAGFEVILIETVGVGQSETQAASMVDFFLVLMIPDAGDELQGIKKGVLEFADTIVVNKADSQNMEKALIAKKVYQNALSIITPSSENWTVPVLTCSALEGTGIGEVWQTVLRHNEIVRKTGEFEKRRKEQEINWMWALLDTYLKKEIFSLPDVKQAIRSAKESLKNGNITADTAALQIMDTIMKSTGK